MWFCDQTAARSSSMHSSRLAGLSSYPFRSLTSYPAISKRFVGKRNCDNIPELSTSRFLFGHIATASSSLRTQVRARGRIRTCWQWRACCSGCGMRRVQGIQRADWHSLPFEKRANPAVLVRRRRVEIENRDWRDKINQGRVISRWCAALVRSVTQFGQGNRGDGDVAWRQAEKTLEHNGRLLPNYEDANVRVQEVLHSNIVSRFWSAGCDRSCM